MEREVFIEWTDNKLHVIRKEMRPNLVLLHTWVMANTNVRACSRLVNRAPGKPFTCVWMTIGDAEVQTEFRWDAGSGHINREAWLRIQEKYTTYCQYKYKGSSRLTGLSGTLCAPESQRQHRYIWGTLKWSTRKKQWFPPVSQESRSNQDIESGINCQVLNRPFW